MTQKMMTCPRQSVERIQPRWQTLQTREPAEKYCWCFHEHTVDATHENTADVTRENTADATRENTVDAHMKAGVGKCDQEEEHAWLGEKREE